MATSAFRLYNTAKKYLLTADLDINAATMRVGLCRGAASSKVSAYTISTWASAYAAANRCSGGTYVQKTLGTISVKSGVSAKVIKFDAADLVWTASGSVTESIKYLVVGISGGKALGWVHLTDSAFDLAMNNTLTISWNASGIFTLSGGVT